MCWKCSNEFYNIDVVKLIMNQTSKFDSYYIRELIFIKMLNYSSVNYIFADSAHVSKLLSLSKKQCDIVWDICISNNVLRKVEGGYSAFDWMSENKLICSEKPVTRIVYLPAKSETLVKEEKPKKTKEYKEAVRYNVWLTRSEIKKLKEEFTDEQIAAMVDKLSDYKNNSNKQYKSDFDAINRWVINWFKQSHSVVSKQSSNSHEDGGFPDWITGKG